MSFLSSAFSGASNNFSPGGGNPQQAAQVTTANNNYGQANTGLNNLAQMLQQQAQGGGPNLANAQLQSATAQNVSNQAALMAGQRGASSNPALIARQAAMQGANIQQQAAGQSAQNVLAQQLAAQSQLGGVLGTQGSLANQNYGITQGAITGNNQIGAQTSAQNAKTNQGLIGGIGNVVGGITGLFAEGGEVDNSPFSALSQGSDFGFNFVNLRKPKSNTMDQMNAGIPQASQQVLGANPQTIQDPTSMYAQGGMAIMKENYSQGGITLPFRPMDLKQGGEVQARAPQEKAIKPGNSYSNDKIPAMVSEGEIVIPRDVAMSPNAPSLAAQFVANVRRKK